MKTHEVLVAAKGYLLTYGWSHGCLGGWDFGEPRCALGAVAFIQRAHRLPHSLEADRALARAMSLSQGGTIGGWNDDPDRTFEEVIDAFDRAILATAPKDTPAPVPAPLVEAPA